MAPTDLPPGKKLKMPEVIVKMKLDPDWNIKASNRDVTEQEDLRRWMVAKRKDTNTALRPTRLSGAKTADILLKRVDGDVS